MAIPNGEQNGVFTHVYPIEDLGFTPDSASDSDITLGNNATANGTVFSTAVGATVLIMTKLASGAATLKVAIGADGFTPDYGSPTSTLALSGTAWQVLMQDTAYVFDDSDGSATTVSTDTRNVGIHLLAGGAGVVVDKMVVLVLYELTLGENWLNNVRSSANAVASKNNGDGHGRLNTDSSSALNPYERDDVLI